MLAIGARWKWLALVLVLFAGGAGGGWAWGQRGDSNTTNPISLASLPEDVAGHYRFVEGHQALAERLPCYCGCGKALDHRNLKDCFLKRDGYNDHASACLICGRIAADAEQLLAAGFDTATIRARIDATYAEYGPPTSTP